MLENKNKQGNKGHITRERHNTIYKIPPRWHGHVERMQNQRMPKQTATSTMEGTRKRGQPCKRWTNEAEEGLNKWE
jgi:hypothetical protein